MFLDANLTQALLNVEPEISYILEINP